MAPHVLVADDDAWILRMVATVLEKRGYSVETAVDGEDALERALARTPDLLITDVMMPKMDGWSLVRQLRSHGELAMLPVIFLTALSSEDDRIRGFRLGADDYVTKPFRFEELDLRVAKTLRRAQQTQQDTRDQLSGSGLRGDLSQVGLSSLLVLIEMERKTGLLQMRAPGGPSGQILVREGKVVHARLDEQEEPVDAECVYYMLTWGAGEFEFIACVVEGVDRVTVSTTHLLMEGARLMDEANEPSLQPAVTIPPRISQEFPAVEPDLDEPLVADPSAAAPPSSDADANSNVPATTASEEASGVDASSEEASTNREHSASEDPAAANKARASAGTLSSMWTLTGDDSVQVDESASIDDPRSREKAGAEPRTSTGAQGSVRATTMSAADANDAPTVIPGGPGRASSPVIPSAPSSENNDAPTVIPGGPVRASSPVIPSAPSPESNDAPTVIPGLPTRASSPAIERPSGSDVTTSNTAGHTSRASSPSMPVPPARASSPAMINASETSRASSPSLTAASETSRASSPSLAAASETSRASSPAIPPIPTPPMRKSTPSMPADKPASASGPMPAVDDPSDDWE